MTSASQPKVLFATSEAHPLIKTGGLADVSGALPAALHAQYLDINKLLLPGTTLPLLNVSYDAFFNHGGGPYQTPSGSNCPDKALRFGLIFYVAAWLGRFFQAQQRTEIFKAMPIPGRLTPVHLQVSSSL